MMRAIATTLPASCRSATFAALIALCLLFAQAIGFAHAFAHAGGTHEAATSQQLSDKLFHHAKASCAAFDAATLGAGLQSTAQPMLPAMAPDAPVAMPLRAGWHRVFSPHFSSRAPPLNA